MDSASPQLPKEFREEVEILRQAEAFEESAMSRNIQECRLTALSKSRVLFGRPPAQDNRPLPVTSTGSLARVWVWWPVGALFCFLPR